MKGTCLLTWLGAAAALAPSAPAQAPLRLRSTGVAAPVRLASGPPPTGLAVTGTPSTATLTWAAPAGATGFDDAMDPPLKAQGGEVAASEGP